MGEPKRAPQLLAMIIVPHGGLLSTVCVCVCVCECMRACVHVCMCECMCAFVSNMVLKYGIEIINW